MTQDERVSLLIYVLLKHGVGFSYTFLFPLGCFLSKVGLSNTISNVVVVSLKILCYANCTLKIKRRRPSQYSYQSSLLIL
jgi:hypothetical protein